MTAVVLERPVGQIVGFGGEEYDSGEAVRRHPHRMPNHHSGRACLYVSMECDYALLPRSEDHQLYSYVISTTIRACQHLFGTRVGSTVDVGELHGTVRLP